MTHCAVCDRDVHPVHDLQSDGRIIAICPTCNGALAVAAAPEPAPSTPAPAPALAPAAIRPASLDFKNSADWHALLRARAAEIANKLSEYDALRVELKQITRMLAASEPRRGARKRSQE